MADENLFLFHAFLLGIFVTFVYDWFRILRRVLRHNGFAVAAEDLGFWTFCAIEVFLLMYRESNGTLRWFAVLGALAGMLLYHKTLSPLFVKYVSLLLGRLLRILGKILGFFWKPVVAAGRGVGRIHDKAKSGRKRFASFLKKRLTVRLKMLKMIGTRH